MTYIPIFFLVVILCLFAYVILETRSRIFFPENAPESKYILVLGAGLEKDGLPTDILSDRVETAVKILGQNKTASLVLSGSVSPQNFSEPESMSDLAFSLGVDRSKLIIDKYGKTTFDSLINIAGFLDNEVVTIVTQRFHLPRALWLANSLKINAYGVSANIYKFSVFKTAYWYLREMLALPINLLKIIINKYQIVL
jgi:SanA protein